MPTTKCEIVIQAGHQNTPDDKTGGSGPLGKEIDWTPIVADEAVRILRAAAVDALKLDASIKGTSHRWECAIAVSVHFDDPDDGVSGASIGYPKPADKPVATAWKDFYKAIYPFGWMKDNFTSNLSGYYGYKYWNTTDGKFLIEFGDLGNTPQATWLKPRLKWLGALLAHFLSQRLGKGDVPMPPPFEETAPSDSHILSLAALPRLVRAGEKAGASRARRRAAPTGAGGLHPLEARDNENGGDGDHSRELVWRDLSKEDFLSRNRAILDGIIADCNALQETAAPRPLLLTRQEAWAVSYAEMGLDGRGRVDPAHRHSLGERGLLPLPENIRFWNGPQAPDPNTLLPLYENVEEFFLYLRNVKNHRYYANYYAHPGVVGHPDKEAYVTAAIVHGYFYSGNYPHGGRAPVRDILDGIAAGETIPEFMRGTGYVHEGSNILVNRQRNLEIGLRLANA